MTIRTAQLDNLDELQKLFVDTVTTICKADYDEKQIEAWTSGIENKQRWQDIMTKQFILVAQHTNKIAGFATLDNGNYIDLLYVHKDHQRQGIAQRLLHGLSPDRPWRRFLPVSHLLFFTKCISVNNQLKDVL